MAKEKVIEFPFRDGKKPMKVGDTVAFTNNNLSRGRTIFTEKVKKIGRGLIYLENDRAFYIDNGRERVSVCGSEIYSSEEAVLYMRKIEKMKRFLSDAFTYGFSRQEHHVTPEKIEKCYRLVFSTCDSCDEPLDQYGGCNNCEEEI